MPNYEKLDDEIRIELIRARIAIEREALCNDIGLLVESAQPANLARGVIGMKDKLSVGNIASVALSAYTRYPLLISLATSVFSGLGRRSAKVGIVGGLVWWLSRLGRRRAKNSDDNAISNFE